jgi:hypothetical protein
VVSVVDRSFQNRFCGRDGVFNVLLGSSLQQSSPTQRIDEAIALLQHHERVGIVDVGDVERWLHLGEFVRSRPGPIRETLRLQRCDERLPGTDVPGLHSNSMLRRYDRLI